jgi:hypothetical protein
MTVRWLTGDVFAALATIPDNSVDLVVTSPPFLALRSYLEDGHPDKDLEIGSEPTPAAFLDTLIALTIEWRRILAPHGTLAVELGDTYAGSGGAGGDYNPEGLRAGQGKAKGSARTSAAARRRTTKGRSRARVEDTPHHATGGRGWPLDKSLTLIPTLYAASLSWGRNLLNPDTTLEPWRVRNVLVWARANPPVGALGDKFRPATSYVTIAAPSARRYFDLEAVRLPASPNTNARTAAGVDRRPTTGKAAEDSARRGNRSTLDTVNTIDGAPPLDWLNELDDGPTGDRLWHLNTQPYPGAHHAVYPPELPRRIIAAMCPQRVCQTCGEPSRRIIERTPEYAAAREAIGDFKKGHSRTTGRTGTTQQHAGEHITGAEHVTTGWTDCGHGTWRPGHVLDPFGGSGTTGAVASGFGLDATLIDLDARNYELAAQRIGMLLEPPVTIPRGSK